MNVLTAIELERYSRQLILKDWSESTQLNLKNSAIIFIGFEQQDLFLTSCGLYLTACGIGTIFFEQKFKDLDIISDQFLKLNEVSIQKIESSDFDNNVFPNVIIISKDNSVDSTALINKLPKTYPYSLSIWDSKNLQILFSSGENPSCVTTYDIANMLEAGTLVSLLATKEIAGF